MRPYWPQPPRRPAPPPAQITNLRPGHDRLLAAWAAAVARNGAIAALAAITPELRLVSPSLGAWVLQGPTTQGSILTACLTAGGALSVLHYGSDTAPLSISIPLADLASPDTPAA